MGLAAVRRLLIALPALTVALVIATLLGPARERHVRAARLYGGPTVGAPKTTFRLELVESAQGRVRLTGSPELEVTVRTASGHEAVWSGAVPDSGVRDLELSALPEAPHEVAIAEGERELLRGKLRVERAVWERRATRRGGFIELRRPAGVDFRVGLERGVLAVPFPDRLLVVLGKEGAPEQGVAIELEADGAELGASRVITDERGHAEVSITPRDHHVTLRVRAELDEPLRSSLALPVVPGALDARRSGGRLVVTSPVPRERAYVTLVTERYRLLGAELTLVPDAAGGASAELLLGALPNEPVWAVVSSAVDLESPARVGWPITAQVSEAKMTFDVPEMLLADGLPAAERRELARKRRVRFAVAGFCAIALLFELGLLARYSAAAQAKLERHFAERGLSSPELTPAPGRRGALWVALLLVALAFALLALFAFLTHA